MRDDLNDERTAFWSALAEAAPELGIEASPGWEKEIPIGCDSRLRIKLSLSQDKSSVYLVTRSEAAEAYVKENLDALARGLRTIVGDTSGEADKGRRFRKDNPRACYTVKGQWPEAIRWFRAQYAAFRRAVEGVETNESGER